jgi:hypothetical protein
MEPPKVLTGPKADDKPKRRRGPRPTTTLRVALLHSEGLKPKEISERLGISRNAVFCSLRKIKHGVLKFPVERYCRLCFRPTMVGNVCYSCGYEAETTSSPSSSEALLHAYDDVHSEPVSLIRRDRGLGSDRRSDNVLINWLRRENGYRNGEGLSMRIFEDLGQTGDDALTRHVLHEIQIMGGFKSGDFEVSEAAAWLARKLIKKYQMRYAEITRTRIREIVVAVLREVSSSYPTRVNLDPSIKAQVNGSKPSD